MDVKFSSKRPLTPEEEAEIQRLIDSDPDAPESTEEEMALARPFREVFSRFCSKHRPGASQGGKEWRGKMTDALRKAAGL